MAKRSDKWSAWDHEWAWGAVLLGAVFLAYTPVWWAGFIWDDDMHLTANPVIIGPLGLKEIWTTSQARICPLVLTTFWFEHALWGATALPYHLVNVLMHGMGAVVLWRVLKSLHVPGAWLGATLWALHPVQVETVAWITELKNTQSGLFYLLSILFFVKWLRTQPERAGRDWTYALTLLFAAMAMASKSSTVILPLVLCLVAWWIDGRWQWQRLTRIAPNFLMSVVASLVSMWTQKLEGATELTVVRTWPERLITAGDVIWFYLGKLAWPHPLIFIYPRWQIEAGAWVSYLPLVAAIVIGIILWAKRETWGRPWFFALGYFVVALLPVLGLVDHYFLRYSFVGDHFQYLASMGPLALAGAGLVLVADRVMPGKSRLRAGFAAGLLLVLGITSWQRAWTYQSDEALWIDTLAKNPDCPMAHNNYGSALLHDGHVDAAMTHFQEVLAMDPNNAHAHINLGNAFVQKGQLDEALAQYQMAQAIEPNDTKAGNNIGNILVRKGRMDDAIAQFQKVLEIDPNYADSHNNIGYAFVQKGQIDEAIIHFRKAIRVNPNHLPAHNNLAHALYQKGQISEALIEFQEVVRLNPNDAASQDNLAKVKAMMGQTPAP